MSQTVTDSETEIRALVQEWEKAAAAKDGRAIAALYAQSATLLPPGQPPISGRENIQTFWQGFLDAGASDARLTPTAIRGSGSCFYEIGQYSAMMPQPTGGTAQGTGRYLVVWERQSDGTLKIAADMFGPDA
jgi:uncharacterized protein (TIGR02246 family)